MVETLFWASLAFVVYVYAGYPLLLALWKRSSSRPVRKSPWEPSVSLVIAAHNERDTIEHKIRNCLELDYPRARLQIVIALDAPTDGTEEVVWRHAGRVVDTVYYSPHRGKAGALNRAMEVAEGEIVVFADARQRLDTAALRHLVANLHDPAVGAVSGELVLLDEHGREAGDGVGLYWRYEKWLRTCESEVHSTLGATGALYAIRRDLYRPAPDDTVLDDVAIPMQIVLSGKRAVFEPAARVYDVVASSPEAEYGRKVRTLMGNYQLLARMPALLAPWCNPVFAQFVSHKVARLLVPWALAALLISNLFLPRGIYLLALAGQIIFYGLAAAGCLLSKNGAANRGAGCRVPRLAPHHHLAAARAAAGEQAFAIEGHQEKR